MTGVDDNVVLRMIVTCQRAGAIDIDKIHVPFPDLRFPFHQARIRAHREYLQSVFVFVFIIELLESWDLRDTMSAIGIPEKDDQNVGIDGMQWKPAGYWYPPLPCLGRHFRAGAV